MEKMKRIWDVFLLPTGIKPIRFVLLFENVFCLYRNLDYYKKAGRIMIYFRVSAEIALTLTCVVFYSINIYSSPSLSTSYTIFFYINETSSITFILLSVYYSKTFRKLLMLIESNDIYFANDEKYQKNMKRHDYYIKRGFIFLTMYVMISSSLKFAQKKVLSLNLIIAFIIFFSNGIMCTCRSMYEYICLYAILSVMSEQIESISRAVSKKRISVAIAVEQCESLSDEDSGKVDLEIKEFDKLSTVFSNIKECSKLFNKIFGLQLVVMLGSSTTYCIIFLYTMAFLSVKGYPDVNDLISNVMKLLVFFILLLLLSLSAQKKQNNVTKLSCQLGKLLIKCVEDDAHYKATKDFLRLVSCRSLKTETLGAIPVDMSLIPSFIMFITSYTVIALQFNNIV